MNGEETNDESRAMAEVREFALQNGVPVVERLRALKTKAEAMSYDVAFSDVTGGDAKAVEKERARWSESAICRAHTCFWSAQSRPTNAAYSGSSAP